MVLLMKIVTRQSNRKGSALLLVIVLTVLLAALAALFILMSRVNEMSSSAAEDERNLDAGIDTVIEHVDQLLVLDLFGQVPPGNFGHLLAEDTVVVDDRPNYSAYGSDNEPYDHPSVDFWLSSIEPNFVPSYVGPSTADDDTYWPYISDPWEFNTYVLGYFDPVKYDYGTRCWDSALPAYYSTDYLIDDTRRILARIVDPRQTTEVTTEGNHAWGAPLYMLDYGARADADGDGVADSRWVRLPGIQSSAGKNIYAAVKIIDNCAMLNLNTAHSLGDSDGDDNIDDTPDDYYGKYLSEVDFSSFLRGYDVGQSDRIRIARQTQDWTAASADIDTFGDYHDNAIMNIEMPDENYILFGITDELEMRNRYMLTSNTLARFEKRELNSEDENGVFPDYYGVAYYTFDLGRGTPVGDYDNSAGYFATRSKRIPHASDDFDTWKDKLNHDYWDSTAPSGYEYMYDRRHVCTFYSFDRNLRRRQYPLIDPVAGTEDTGTIDTILMEAPGVFYPVYGSANARDIIPASADADDVLSARKNVLHLLYAFRAYFVAEDGLDYHTAAHRSAQIVANMIDYCDYEGGFHPFNDPSEETPVTCFDEQLPANMTYIDRDVIRELIIEVSTELYGTDIDIDSTDEWLSSGRNQNDFDFGLDPQDIVYGFEAQPYINELYSKNDDTGSNLDDFKIELYNPYSTEIAMDSTWCIQINGTQYDFPAKSIPSGARVVFDYDDFTPAISLSLGGGTFPLRLRRQCPDDSSEYLTLDRTDTTSAAGSPNQLEYLLSSSPPGGTFVSRRVDAGWEFTNYLQHREGSDYTPGTQNFTLDPDSSRRGYQLPVADNEIHWGTLIDFVRMPLIGNDPNDPNTCVTCVVANAADEADIRYDYQANPALFEYISLLNRDNGRIPGRININTATREVIAAAIPESDNGSGVWDPEDIADAIVTDRDSTPFAHLYDLYTAANTKDYFLAYYNDPNDNVGQAGGIDFEERDWILSLVFNKFTVRSDVFTAYILVRLDVDGPEKRMIAIFDRSQVYEPSDKPKLIALHPVSDPR